MTLATIRYQLAVPAASAILGVRRSLRSIAGRKGRTPDFIIAGAQKAATTSLYNFMLQHPRVGPALTKEVHFFDNNFHRGEKWYRLNFPDRTPPGCDVTGEASPYYLVHPLVPARIREICPEVRIIVLLRDPVARAISHYQHEYRRGFERQSLTRALEMESSRLDGEFERMVDDPTYRSYAFEHYSYVTRGRYADQLRRWLDEFPREQILILESERLGQDTESVLDRVGKFLELDHWSPSVQVRHNRGRYEAPPSRIESQLRETFAGPNRDLVALLGQEFSWVRNT